MVEISRRRGKEDRGSSVDASLTFGPDGQVILGKPSAGALMTVGHKPSPHPQIPASTASSNMRFTNQVVIFNNHSPPTENLTPAPRDIEEIMPTNSTTSNGSLNPSLEFGEVLFHQEERGTTHDATIPKDDDENEDRKREMLRNSFISRILDDIDENLNKNMQDDLRKKIIEDLWEDFSSNQEYQSSITANAPGSTQQNPPIPTKRHPPLAHDEYTAKLAPKTYYGVGIETKLVQEENQNSFLQISRFYDNSKFQFALEDNDPLIETAKKVFKITAICCELGDGKKEFYTIDQIFENCDSNEETFNLKLCDIFRNPKEKDLELKFSTLEGSGEDQKLTIQKSVFTKDKHGAEYKDIKTVISESKIKDTSPSTHILVAESNKIRGSVFLG